MMLSHQEKEATRMNVFEIFNHLCDAVLSLLMGVVFLTIAGVFLYGALTAIF